MSERAQAVPALAEAFRTYGYDGASLALLGEATGLGRGSLYNFFPGGKEEMAAAVLDDVGAWFEQNVFGPLRAARPRGEGLNEMFAAVVAYFRSGQRICLQGAFALGDERDTFGAAVRGYFERWIDALAGALRSEPDPPADPRSLALDTVSRIQGAIVVSRALGDPDVFVDIIGRLRDSLTAGGEDSAGG